VNRAIKHKDEGRLRRLSNAEGGGRHYVISTVHELRASLTVESLAKLIALAIVVRRHVILEQAHIALGFAAVLQPCEARVDVAFAARATEWTIFTKVDNRYLSCTLSVIILSGLCQWLYHEAECDTALLLHFLVLGCLHGGSSEEPRRTLALINGNLWHGGRRRELCRRCAVLKGGTGARSLSVQMFNRARQGVLRRWLALPSRLLLCILGLLLLSLLRVIGICCVLERILDLGVDGLARGACRGTPSCRSTTAERVAWLSSA